MKASVLTAVALALAAAVLLPGTASAAKKPKPHAHTWVVTAGAEGALSHAARGVQANDYLPRELWIDAGDTVLWKVTTGEPHTITFLGGAAKPQFDPTNPQVAGPVGGSSYAGAGYHNSGILPLGALGGPKGGNTYRLRFTKPGDYSYYCLMHGEMVGVVHVLPQGTPLPFTPAQYRNVDARQTASLVDRGKLLERVALQAAEARGHLVVSGTGSGRVADEDFFPATLTIHAGESVTFLNLDPETPHNVMFGTEPKDPGAVLKPYGNPSAYAGGDLNSGYFGVKPPWAGPTFTVRFTKAGTYDYICALHDGNGMKGRIVVQP